MPTIGRVLDVAALDHGPVGTQQGRANAKFGVAHIGVRFGYAGEISYSALSTEKMTLDGCLDEFFAGFSIDREWHDNRLEWYGTKRGC